MAFWEANQPAAPLACLVFPEALEKASRNVDDHFPTPVLALNAELKSKGYSAAAIPLTTDHWKVRWSKTCIVPNDFENDIEAQRTAEAWRARPVFNLDEVTMTRLDEAQDVVGMVSDWLELDSSDDWVRTDAEIALQQELAYASYLNVATTVLPGPRNRENVASYARTVNACLTNTPFINISVRLPIYDPSVFNPDILSLRSGAEPPPMSISLSSPSIVLSESHARPSNVPEAELNATWEMWDLIRTICDYNPRLSLALDLTLPLPSAPNLLKKWIAEPVKHIFLPASSFIANAKGYPVLPKTTQAFIRDSITASGEAAYSQYVRHLEKTSPSVQAAKQSGTVENFAQGYQDFLQAPLQPLMDNLQSSTYETFEQDPVKYRHYEEAIHQAITEWPASDDNKLVLCVAGAGRGPLVARTLLALEKAGKKATVLAVEKNPNAFVTLQLRKTRDWGDKVDVFFGDMRQIELPERVDILISELLGSFGDNELSPECLDGAMRFLKPGGISIPSSYTAHIAPLSSSKLHVEVSKTPASLETPYVVMFEAANILSGDGQGPSGKCGGQVQPCWEFEHPRKDVIVDERGLPLTNSHNSRATRLKFHIPHAGILHGLAGYFEAVLYGNIGLSIHPHRKDQISKNMLSWFPLFFPIKEPLYLPSNSELHVSLWRLTNERQVWYEWHAEAFLAVPTSTNYSSELGTSSRPLSVSGVLPMVNGGSLPLTASPLLDAEDAPHAVKAERRRATHDVTALMVKIGQTSLHNPNGRSSWIGL
ncbi:PRMT5-domain-containing protein [Fistulina hepatica ATCC 64428]|nr:PRMT5-domain-containing protein [Fistulina hepatica ATCC 64428]